MNSLKLRLIHMNTGNMGVQENKVYNFENLLWKKNE
jgi:hypothetical protein